MKHFDVLVIGSGSGATIVDGALQSGMNVALVEKDELGGTCLNRGCIPSKMVIYPADLVNTIKHAEKLGLKAKIENIDFSAIMERTRQTIKKDRLHMEESIPNVKGLEYYHDMGEFVDDYVMEVGGDTLRADNIFIVSGSRPLIPPVKGLDKIDYLTNDNVWNLEERPDSLIIIGGGLIAVEMGHFFSAMGTNVKIISRSPRLLKFDEPEISYTLMESMGKRMKIIINTEFIEADKKGDSIRVIAIDEEGKKSTHTAESLFLATGRMGNADLLRVEKTGVEADERGFIKVNNHYETGKARIWAFGDAIGRAMFKHVANKEAALVWHAFRHEHKEVMDYEKVPYAVFGWPQVASVGLTEQKAKEKNLEILVGYYNYADTAKGEAMGEEEGFVKVVVEDESYKILGAHIIGPYAPILIQGVIDIINSKEPTVNPIYQAMYIHPALPEVVQRAFLSLRKP
jgi:dihydrolipoamide dehydrogenase